MDENIKKYLSEIGRKGGRAKTEKKAKASAANGKKGGRPRKSGGQIPELSSKELEYLRKQMGGEEFDAFLKGLK